MNTYDIFYKKMTESDRKDITNDISNILQESIKESVDLFKKGVESAVTKMYENVVVNPWIDWINTNGSSYEFLDAVKSFVWKQMLKSNPSDINKFHIKELLEAWKNNFPEDYEKEINREYVVRAESAEKALKEISLRIIKN